MLTRFLDVVAGKLATEWLTISSQSLVFWGGGLAAWAAHTGASPLDWLQARPPGTRAFLVVGLVLAIAGSAVAVRRLVPGVLGLLEGYGWPTRIRSRFTRRQGQRRAQLGRRWRVLCPLVETGSASAEEYTAFVRVDAAMRRIPAAPHRQLPTWVGNMLRAAEQRPFDKYGLDAVKCWPHLWLVLPQEARSQLATARAALESAVCALIWAAAFIVWTPWAWWAAPAALLAIPLLYRFALRAPCVAFADLLEAAFDLYRPDLYAALRWPAPRTPAEEQHTGSALTTYLWRGSDHTEPTFTRSPALPSQAGEEHA